MRSVIESIFGFRHPVSRGEAIGFRLIEMVTSVFTLHYAWKWALYMMRLEDVFLPLGIAHYLDVSVFFQSPWPFVNAALISGLVIAGAFRLYRHGYLGALILLHVQYAARFSQGEIPHSQNATGVLLLALGMGAVFSASPALRQRFSMGIAYLLIGFGYTSAAFCKLVATGWTWPDGRHLWLWTHEKSIDVISATGHFELNLLQEYALDHWWIATAFLTVGLVSEFFAVGMAFRRYRSLIVSVVLGLHAGIYLTMNILFFQTTVLLVLLFVYPFSSRLDDILSAPVLQAVHRIFYPRWLASSREPEATRAA
jgi:hypothetical protein